MENVKVQYVIDQAAAVLAGKSRYGTVTVDIDPATLTEEQRAELITCSHITAKAYELDRSIGGSSLNGDEERAIFPYIAEPADDVPARLLNARIALRKASTEKKTAKDAETAAEKARLKAIDAEVGADPDAFLMGEGVDLKLRNDIQGIPMYGNESVLPNIIALRKTIEERVDAARKLAKFEQESKCRMLWGAFIEAHGTADQIDRFNANCLPSDERDDLACGVIFNTLFKDCPVYEKLQTSDVTHDSEDCYGEIKFRGSSAGDYDQTTKTLTPNKYGNHVELDSSEWKALNAVLARLPLGNVDCCGTKSRILVTLTFDKIDLEIRRHEAYCDDCDAVTTRLGIRVTIKWNGSKFEQEYAL